MLFLILLPEAKSLFLVHYTNFDKHIHQLYTYVQFEKVTEIPYVGFAAGQVASVVSDSL